MCSCCNRIYQLRKFNNNDPRLIFSNLNIACPDTKNYKNNSNIKETIIISNGKPNLATSFCCRKHSSYIRFHCNRHSWREIPSKQIIITFVVTIIYCLSAHKAHAQKVNSTHSLTQLCVCAYTLLSQSSSLFLGEFIRCNPGVTKNCLVDIRLSLRKDLLQKWCWEQISFW